MRSTRLILKPNANPTTLQPDGWWYDGGGMRDVSADATYPVHSRIASVQRSALTGILNPSTLNRAYDNEYRADGEDVLTVPEIMDTVRGSVWGELGTRPDGSATVTDPYISSLRRNLQRSHLERVVDLSGESNGFGSTSATVASLARQQLRDLDQEIGEILSRDGDKLDAYSRAHLADAKAIIDRVLNSDYIYTQSSGGGGMSPFMMLFGR